MFSSYHLIWLCICTVLIIISIILLKKYKPSFNSFFNIAIVICIFSELIKIFSVITFVSSGDGSSFFPYIEMKHLPFHLCYIQMLFILIVRFTKNDKLKEYLLAFMFPSCITRRIFCNTIAIYFSKCN